jgi:hypothetical protein
MKMLNSVPDTLVKEILYSKVIFEFVQSIFLKYKKIKFAMQNFPFFIP